MESISQRAARASESLLENESLTADLDDNAAKALLDWGLARANEIAYRTLEILDEEMAQEAMYGPMKALRRMLRAVNKWAVQSGGADAATAEASLAEIVEYAAVVYGEPFRAPDEASRLSFLNQIENLRNEPAIFIGDLLHLINNSPPEN